MCDILTSSKGTAARLRQKYINNFIGCDPSRVLVPISSAFAASRMLSVTSMPIKLTQVSTMCKCIPKPNKKPVVLLLNVA